MRGTGEQGHYFRRTREQRSKNAGNRGTKANLGNIENQDFGFREQENKAIYFRGTREQVPPRRASKVHKEGCFITDTHILLFHLSIMF